MKTQRVNLRVASRDDELFRCAAAVADESFLLPKKDWAAFAEAVDRPAQADSKLVELFRRPRPA
jgi:uncharacterized protein (DUF1778 family)